MFTELVVVSPEKDMSRSAFCILEGGNQISPSQPSPVACCPLSIARYLLKEESERGKKKNQQGTELEPTQLEKLQRYFPLLIILLFSQVAF